MPTTTMLPEQAIDVSGWPRSGAAGVTRTLVQAPMFAMLSLLAPTRVSGLEELEGMRGPVLFAANHTSHLDTPVILKALPASRRHRMVVAAAADYFFSKPLVGTVVSLAFNAFPFARTQCAGVRATLTQCNSLIEDGWSMLIYPEGTRSTDGRLGTFKPGLGLLAVHLGMSVVPICTTGLFRILPKGKCMLRPGRAEIRFGKPLAFAEGDNYRDATRAIEDSIREMAKTMEMPGGERRAKVHPKWKETYVAY